MKNRATYEIAALAASALLGILIANPLLVASQDPRDAAARFPEDLRQKVKYVIILYLENRSFDSLYGSFPGANGLAEATEGSKTQLTPTGSPYPTLPQPTTNGIPGLPNEPDQRFNGVVLKNGPYDLNPFVPNNAREGDLVHRFYTEQYQINSKRDRFKDDPKNTGGDPMSKFVAWSDNPGLTMGNYDVTHLDDGVLAQQYVLCENNFHSAFGGSFLNHIWLVAARTPVWPAKPSEGGPPSLSNATNLDGNGYPMLKGSGMSDGRLTNDSNLPGFPKSNAEQTLGPGDYWCVNTTYPLRGPAGGTNAIEPTPPEPPVVSQPASPTSDAPVADRLPLQHFDSIGGAADRTGRRALVRLCVTQSW
jgi:acid phosphatase